METGAERRVGILGGSFDPVHIGHLIIAQDALERLELTEVVFVPAYIPPHKQHLDRVDSNHRFSMLQLATETDMRFTVSDVELRRGGLSYTFDTIQDMATTDPKAEHVLIVGSDTLVDMHTWHRIDELLEMCSIATFLRPGLSSLAEIEERINFDVSRKEELTSRIIESHLVEVSSTEIRMRVAEGLSIRYLVPNEVEMYIYEHGLYRG
jgi:nicotinate-nucleotide adenylyltransferase